MEKKIRCGKCFVTLAKLKETGISDYLVRIVKENGQEDFICTTCLAGW